MDLRDIQNLIRFVAKSGASEVKLEMEDIKITIKTSGEEARAETVYVQQPLVTQGIPSMPVTIPQQPVVASEPQPTATTTTKNEDVNDKFITIKKNIWFDMTVINFSTTNINVINHQLFPYN